MLPLWCDTWHFHFPKSLLIKFFLCRNLQQNCYKWQIREFKEDICSKIGPYVVLFIQDKLHIASMIINRILLSSATLLHLSVIAYSRFQEHKQRKAEMISISIIYTSNQVSQPERHATVNIESILFFCFAFLGSFLIHSGSRNAQLYVLLPLQMTVCSLIFPICVICGHKKMRKQFCRDFEEWKRNLCFKNSVSPE